jgi:hypothetical protein
LFQRSQISTSASLTARLAPLVGVDKDHALLYLYREKEFKWIQLRDSMVRKSKKGQPQPVAPQELESLDDHSVFGSSIFMRDASRTPIATFS